MSNQRRSKSQRNHQTGKEPPTYQHLLNNATSDTFSKPKLYTSVSLTNVSAQSLTCPDIFKEGSRGGCSTRAPQLYRRSVSRSTVCPPVAHVHSDCRIHKKTPKPATHPNTAIHTVTAHKMKVLKYFRLSLMFFISRNRCLALLSYFETHSV